MRVNKLLKVIARRKSGTVGIWTCDLQIQKPTRWSTQPPRLTATLHATLFKLKFSDLRVAPSLSRAIGIVLFDNLSLERTVEINQLVQ